MIQKCLHRKGFRMETGILRLAFKWLPRAVLPNRKARRARPWGFKVADSPARLTAVDLGVYHGSSAFGSLSA